MSQNSFLNQFIKNYQRSTASTYVEEGTNGLIGTTMKQAPTGAKLAKEKTPKDETTYKSIIEEKPPRADVIEYFKHRITDILAHEERKEAEKDELI
jgi:hypothetical protein